MAAPPDPELRYVCASPAMTRADELASRVAQSPATTVLVQGESGCGRELLARLIHQRTPERARHPFLVVCCVGAADWLLDSHLFGNGPTEALGTRDQGALARAAGGTLFLKEVGALGAAGQEKVLRLVRQAAGVAGPGSVRVIASAQPELAGAVRRGTFRADLFQELDVFHVDIPPLRQRREDVLPMARHFLEAHAARLNRTPRRLHSEAAARLLGYDFPGNGRELRNVIERAVILESGAVLGPGSIVLHPAAPEAPAPGASDHLSRSLAMKGRPPTLAEVEREYLIQLLEYTRGNRTMAARLMGVSYPTVMKKIVDYGVDIERFKIAPGPLQAVR